MEYKEKMIQSYFKAWLNRDSSVLSEVFDANVIYVECYGPNYHGLEQILQWFSDWHKKGSVLEWSIKQFIHQNNFTVVEWYFQCDYENNVDGFDGVSLITFNEQNQITSVKEFQSKAVHYDPYDDMGSEK
jgi:hypothetical protein